MDAQRWQHIKKLMNTALEHPVERREAVLHEACPDDPQLLQEVKSLLIHHLEAQTFLEPASTQFPTETLIGTVLDGKYQIELLLGVGGMGAVYRATHLGTERPVAVKIVSPEFTEIPQFVERFKREAKAAGKLSHPNVVNVTDFGCVSFSGKNVTYLVMEQLKGLTLGSFLKQQGRLPLELVLEIIEQICLGIDSAHQQGVIHRDLKPDNIWLQPDGRNGFHVKVLDFGIARLMPNQAPGSISGSLPIKPTTPTYSIEAETPELTQGGIILGSPAYISPEQSKGEPVDERSDIYSLGVMTYQMLSGETPFTGDVNQLLSKHKQDIPAPLSEKRTDLPPGVAAVVMSALAKQPFERPRSALAYRNGLRAHAVDAGQVFSNAVVLFIRHFRPLMLMAFCIQFPAVAMYLLLVWAVSQTSPNALPIEHHYLQKTAILLWFMIGLATNSMNTAGCGVFLDGVFKGSQPTVQQVLKRIVNRLPALVLTQLQNAGGLLVQHLLSAPVVVLEDLPGHQAQHRSKELVSRLAGTVFPIHILNFCTTLLLGILFPTTIVISGLWIDFYQTEPSFRELVRVFHLVFPMTILLLCQTPVSVATALVYRQARQAGGESVPESSHQPSTTRNLPSHSTMPRTLALLCLFSILMVFPMGYFLVQHKLFGLVVRSGYDETVKSLLLIGVDVNLKDFQGKTPLSYAKESGRQNLIQLLKQAGAHE